jgi:hypothetical protein
VDPCDFADLLPQVFILGRRTAGRYPFRLGGGLLEDLHGQDLRQADFIGLWRAADRPKLQTAMEAGLRRGQAIMVDARGETEGGQAADFEILLAPMISASGQADRFLGLYQPMSPLQRLYGRALASLSAIRVHTISCAPGAERLQPFPQLRLAAVDGRRIA